MPEQDDPVKRAAEYVRRPDSSSADFVFSGLNGLAKWIVLIFGGFILLLFLLSILAKVFGGIFARTAGEAQPMEFGIIILFFLSIPIIFFLALLEQVVLRREQLRCSWEKTILFDAG